MPRLNSLPLFASLALAASAFAQSSTLSPRAGDEPPDETVKLEPFIVTGSNIPRVDAETALPVTVIEAADLDARGAATMADLFETLGAAEPSAITEINNGPQLARGDVASVDLRGIGSGSTLVLVNGRRMAPHPISMAENGVPSLAVNINAVPRTLIKRVEILRDGASAIYGADAAAGVINNLVSRDFLGRGFTLKRSMTQHGGADEFGATVYDAFQIGKTHVSVSLDYFHRDILYARDRSWSKNADLRLRGDVPAPWDGQPLVDANGATVRDNDLANTNNVNQWGQWQRGFIQPDFLTFVGSRPDGNRGITTSSNPPTGVATMASNGMFYLWPSPDGIKFKQTVPSKNIDSPENARYSNWNNWKTLIPRTDRLQLGVFLDRPLNERVSLFGDLLYYRAYSRTEREPTNFKNTDDQGIYMPKENPYNPFGVRFYHPTGEPNADGTPRLVGTPADVSLWTGISPGQNSNDGTGFRPRETEVYSNAWRVLGGVRGKLGENWEWESALLASGAQTHEFEHYQVRESFLRQALARTDTSAFNPFPVTFKIAGNQIVVDQPYVNPPQVLDPLYDDEDRFGRTELFLWDAKVSGELWRLFRGGNIGVASGVEVRYESFEDHRAPYVGQNPPGSGDLFPYLREGDNDFLALSSNVPISAHQTIYAAYAEMTLPFVTRENRIALIDSLELDLAARFEHFSIFGQTTKPKASVVWNPVRWLKLRGSMAESFRAPNLVQTNITPLRRQIGADDPYRFEVTGLPSDGTSQRTVFRQGNQDLQPEEARTWSAGFVLEVPKVRGLSVAFDYFHIEQESVIENVGAGPTLDRDQLLLDLATQAALAAGTPIDQIDLGSGTDSYQGYGKVTRTPVSDEDRAAFAAYNAAQTSNASRRAPVGEVVSIIDDYVNLSRREIQGYEFGFQWRLPETPLGRFTLNGEATHYVLRRSQEEEGAPLLDELERNGRTTWRANASLSWRKGAWSAGWFANYYGAFVDTSAATTQAVYDALGQPDYIRVFNDNGITRYLLEVDPFIYHNAWLSYQFGRRDGSLWSGVKLRGGVNNVFDEEPSLADEQFGYRSGAANARGRQFTIELSKRF